MDSSGYPENDPKELGLVSKVIDEITESVIEIGRNSNTAYEFSEGLIKIVPRFPPTKVLPIFEVIRENFPKKPEVNRVYQGRVIQIMKMDYFVRLDGFKETYIGLVAFRNVGNVLKLMIGQTVFVKVISISNSNFLSLSMKAIDQNTGKVLASSDGISPANYPKIWSLIQIAEAQTAVLKNLSDPVPPEVRQLPIILEGENLGLLVISETCCNDMNKVASYLEEAKNRLSVRQAYLDEETLLKAISKDENLSDYSAIVIGQDRKRTTTLDILFGLLKKLFSRRSDFQLIFASSATVEADKLTQYFSNCRVFTVPRINYPVQTEYAKQQFRNYLDMATDFIFNLKKIEGDILLLLAGEEEISLVCHNITEHLRKNKKEPELIVLPVYSGKYDPALGASNQRKVIVTTRVESEFEFDKVSLVIDCGLEKQSVYSPKLETNTVALVPISQASARTRLGLVGHLRPEGACYRLYSKTAYLKEMGPTTIPDIQRTNLGETVLRMKALDIGDPSSFDFIDPPPPELIVKATRQLYCLGALDERGILTSRGRVMAEFPVGPILSRILTASVDLRCSEQVLTIIAMVCTGNVFQRPEEKLYEADEKRAGFFRPEGDHLTLLAVFEAWKENGLSRQWCLDNFVDYELMRRAKEFKHQLVATMTKLELEIVSSEDYTNIMKSIAAGLFFHTAKWDSKYCCYRTGVDNRIVQIHSISALFHQKPSCVVFDDLQVMADDEEYMIGITCIDPNWLDELAPLYFRKADPTETMSQQERRGCVAPIYDEPKRVKRSD